MLQEYFAYLKNNPEKYWFKRKAYGWGWAPTKWEGWLTLVVFLGFIALFAFDLASNNVPSSSDFVWFFVKILAADIGIIAVCFLTGEPPKWQWGIQKK